MRFFSSNKFFRHLEKQRNESSNRILKLEVLEGRDLLSADGDALSSQGYTSNGGDTIYVTSAGDTSDIDDGLITLREAISYANNNRHTTIKFSVIGSISLNNSLTINKNISIDALEQTITLDGKDQASGLMKISGGSNANNAVTVTLKNISFINGSNENNGGALTINNYAKVEIDRCMFLSNSALGNGGAIYSNSYSDVQISNSHFENNQSRANNGGAIYVNAHTSGTVTIDSSVFTNNSASSNSAQSGLGGAIYMTSGTESNFVENLTICNSTFTGNESSYGGAVYLQDAWLSISDSLFHNNTAQKFGGAIYQSKLNFVHYLVLTSCEFTVNTALSGGALSAGGGSSSSSIYDLGAFVISKNNLYENNTATTTGGAVVSYSEFRSYGDTFQSNSAQNGGACYNGYKATEYGSIHFDNGTFTNNSASIDGGAIFNTGKMEIDQSVFNSNSAKSKSISSGGAIRSTAQTSIEEMTAVIKNSVFANNFASLRGGAIDNGGRMNITTSFFTGNTNDLMDANSAGGGALFNTTDAFLTLTACDFSGNSSNAGATINNKGYNTTDSSGIITEYALTINSCRFEKDNYEKTSQNYGGGIASVSDYKYDAYCFTSNSLLSAPETYSKTVVIRDANGKLIETPILLSPMAISSDTGKTLYTLFYTICNEGTSTVTLKSERTRQENNILKFSFSDSESITLDAGESYTLSVTVQSTNIADLNWAKTVWKIVNENEFVQFGAVCVTVAPDTNDTNILLTKTDFVFSDSNYIEGKKYTTSYKIALTERPKNTTTVFFKATNGVLLSSEKLTFTVDNWHVKQEVFVTKVPNVLAAETIADVLISHFCLQGETAYTVTDASAVAVLHLTIPKYSIHQEGTTSTEPQDSAVESITCSSLPEYFATSKSLTFSVTNEPNVTTEYQLVNLTVLFRCESDLTLERVLFNWGDGILESCSGSQFVFERLHLYTQQEDTSKDFQISITLFYADNIVKNREVQNVFIIPNELSPKVAESATFVTDSNPVAFESVAISVSEAAVATNNSNLSTKTATSESDSALLFFLDEEKDKNEDNSVTFVSNTQTQTCRSIAILDLFSYDLDANKDSFHRSGLFLEANS